MASYYVALISFRCRQCTYKLWVVSVKRVHDFSVVLTNWTAISSLLSNTNSVNFSCVFPYLQSVWPFLYEGMSGVDQYVEEVSAYGCHRKLNFQATPCNIMVNKLST